MNIIYKFVFSYILILIYNLQLRGGGVEGKEIKIKYQDENFYKFFNIINGYQEEEDLILNFTDQYYDMTDIPQVNNDITIHSNVILRGHAKGTILDYNSNKFGTFTILYAQKQKTFKLENFIVKNYRGVSEDDNDSNLPLFDISNAKVGDDFNFVVKNCQFMNIAYDIFTFHIDSSAETNKNYPITFDSCQFM